MNSTPATLTPSQHARATSIIASIHVSRGYQFARQFIRQAALSPRERVSTCTIEHVSQAMAEATGFPVSTAQMAMALADEGFTARSVRGLASTNVRLRGLQRAVRKGVVLPWPAQDLTPGPGAGHGDYLPRFLMFILGEHENGTEPESAE